MAFKFNPLSGSFDIVPGSTDEVAEGATNLYFTAARSLAANAAAHSTGVKTGGVLSIGTGGAGVATTFTIALGTGMIVDNTVIPATLSEISWTAKTDVAVTNIGTQPLTFVAIDSDGNVIQQATDFTDAQQRQYIIIGTVIHTDLTTVTAVNQIQHLAISPQSQMNDLMQALSGFNYSGNVFSANGANLNINKSTGILFKQGSNYATSANSPNSTTTGSLTAASFRYNNQTGAASGILTAIDPDNYDNAGSTTAVPVNKFTTQRIFLFPSNLIAIQRGQSVYNSLAEAKAAIQTETFVVNSSISPNGVLRAFLIVRQGVTDLTSATETFFLSAPKFGGTAGVGGLSVSTLQNAYDNSISPEIVTDATRLALTIKRGSGADTDNIIEGLNGAGTTTFSLKGNGAIDVSGDATFNTIVNLLATNSAGTVGVIQQASAPWIYSRGTNNLFAGTGSGNLTFNTGNTLYTTGVGALTLVNLTVGSDNTATGYGAGYSITSSSRNACFGTLAGAALTSGSGYNNAFGYEALRSCQSGAYNLGIAANSLYNVVTGSRNIGLGLTSMSGGDHNDCIGIGQEAGAGVGAMQKVVAIGSYAYRYGTGNEQVMIGYNSGVTVTTGNKLTLIGSESDSSAATATNATAIGYKAIVGASNCLVLGGTDGASTGVNVGINITIPTEKSHVLGNAILDNQGVLKLTELNSNGSSYIGLKAPASLSATTTFTLPSADGAANQRLRTDGSAALSFADEYDKISFGFDGGTLVMATGLKARLAGIGYSGTIVGWYLVGDLSGSVTVDIWKSNAAVPTVGNTITASAKPALSSAQYGASTTLTGWTTTFLHDDVFIANIDSATTITNLSLVLRVKKG